GLAKETQEILTDFNAQSFDQTLLRRLFIFAVDIDHPHEPDTKVALRLLSSVLEDPSQADSAWAILTTDAGDLCARRLRRTRHDLVSLLGLARIKVLPPEKDARWHRQLDFSKQLLAKRHAASARMVLTELENQLDALSEKADVDP